MHMGIAVTPVAAVAGWMAGAAWYGLLGKKWTGALGWTDEDLARMRQHSPLVPMIFSLIAELVMAVVLLVAMGPAASPRLLTGAIDGAVLWLGFVATTTGVNYAFQRRSMALLAIDGGHWLMVLVIQGALIGLLR